MLDAIAVRLKQCGRWGTVSLLCGVFLVDGKRGAGPPPKPLAVAPIAPPADPPLVCGPARAPDTTTASQFQQHTSRTSRSRQAGRNSPLHSVVGWRR